MSEQTPEKEIEVVAGVIGSTIRKKEDTWQIEVDVGQQNPKRLWTKDAELVKAMEAKFGQHGAFVCGASYWTNREGVEVRSLWINSVGEGDEVPGVTGAPEAASSVATPAAAGRVYAPDLKDRMIVRQTALKAAAEIVAPRAGSAIDPDYDAALETMKAAQRFETWVYRDIDIPPSEAGRPPLSEHDDQIPF